jgi:hypothetical protein
MNQMFTPEQITQHLLEKMARNLTWENKVFEATSEMYDDMWITISLLQGDYLSHLPMSKSDLVEKVFQNFDSIIAVMLSLECQPETTKETDGYMQSRVRTLGQLWTVTRRQHNWLRNAMLSGIAAPV